MTHDDPVGGRHGLQRSRTDRVLGGVCAGIAERLDLDPLPVRFAAVDLALPQHALVTFRIGHPTTTALRSPLRPAEEVVLP